MAKQHKLTKANQWSCNINAFCAGRSVCLSVLLLFSFWTSQIFVERHLDVLRRHIDSAFPAWKAHSGVAIELHIHAPQDPTLIVDLDDALLAAIDADRRLWLLRSLVPLLVAVIGCRAA